MMSAKNSKNTFKFVKCITVIFSGHGIDYPVYSTSITVQCLAAKSKNEQILIFRSYEFK